MVIDLEIKKQCVELKNSGKSAQEIYTDYFIKHHTGMTVETFSRALRKWKKKVITDNNILEAANLNNNYTPYASTVQVDGEGNVVQAWIKQSTNEQNLERLIEAAKVQEKVEYIEPIKKDTNTGRMLEIPLFDMHFGINDLNYYFETLTDILNLIELKHWECIQFIVGQDLFHNDDFRGRTTKGTQIQQVDIEQAYKDSRTFYFNLIKKAIECSDSVEIHYSQGNHDETVSWFFFQLLKQAFDGQASFDDSREPRKCIHWNNIFIGYGHCDDGRTSPKDIRCQFTIEFPIEFAHSQTREVHLGHLHTEFKDGDESGVVIRRLSTKNQTDSWHNKNGYVGNHKRFMLFEYSHDNLMSVHYV